MLNDSDDKDKFEGEDSEYHFSDEEVSYEVEPEPQKTPPSGGPKETIMARLARSKRLIISALVFLGLIFVVYKMVSPTSSVPPTEISPAPLPLAQQKLPLPPTPVQPVFSVTGQPQAPIVPPQVIVPPSAPAVAVLPPSVAPPTTVNGVLPPPGAVVQTTIPVTNLIMGGASPSGQPVAPPQAPVTAAQAPIVIPATTPIIQQPATLATQPMLQPMAQPQPVVQPLVTQPQIAAQPHQTVVQPGAQLPSLMPVETPVPESPQTFVSTLPTTTTAVDTRITSLQAESDKLINQLQAEYSRKLSDFSNQNRALQDEVQTLNSRVANMESQLNQLLHALNRQNYGGIEAVPPPPPRAQAIEQKISYNVQAIIPGRAWLRSDSGETVTVAEGDIIRDLGRVTKIDPYDGIVQINTGQKLISLSYGNGG
jgi:hypothetical protein